MKLELLPPMRPPERAASAPSIGRTATSTASSAAAPNRRKGQACAREEPTTRLSHSLSRSRCWLKQKTTSGKRLATQHFVETKEPTEFKISFRCKPLGKNLRQGCWKSSDSAVSWTRAHFSGPSRLWILSRGGPGLIFAEFWC